MFTGLSSSQFYVGAAQHEDDLRQILALQKLNLRTEVSAAVKATQGFVTVQHDLSQLRTLFDAAPQIVVKDAGAVVAYALAMPPSLRELVPVLVPMFEVFDAIEFEGKPLREQRFFVNGQICVAEQYRGQGLFEMLCQGYQAQLSGRFDLCVTEISTSNPRSLRAHERVGFRIIHHFCDETDEWDVVAWRL